ncbi:MAG: sulfurtransferase complex subunit TusB [Rhodospirillaceae bacterium]|jgi:tRNA 2-thiouridine synthesizing protein B|nr:sulfurtransferase complex subunit TusB [Rhodospirillaceae bacterium]
MKKILHIVNKSPFTEDALQSCLNHFNDFATLLLIENGVYAMLEDSTFAKRFTFSDGERSVYVLWEDLVIRGLDKHSLISNFQIVDYLGFVQLVANHSVVQSWF